MLISCTTADGNGPATLKDVMLFLTGCDCVPPLGFGDVDPCILFSKDVVLPTVSTCSLTLRFPTDIDGFKDKMDLSILGSQDRCKTNNFFKSKNIM